MNNWYISFTTTKGKKGIAIVAAPTIKDAKVILDNQGRYKDEGYTIDDAQCHVNSCEERRIIQETLADYNMTEVYPYKKRVMHTDYLYYLEMDDYLDYNYAYTFFKKYKPVGYAGCTSFKKGNFFVRNFDWYYNFQVEFVINLKPKNKYSTLGVASYPKITRDTINNFDNYKILPFFLTDGINEKGVFCNINVVPGNEDGWIKTTGTVPTKELREELCMLMIPRFVLDNFKTAEEAVGYLKEYTSIYAPVTEALSDYECHFMIGDSNSLYVVEFVNNEIKIIEENNEVITNFRLYNTSLNSDGTINYTTVSPFGSGLERFNIIKKKWNSLPEDALSLWEFALGDLRYTKSYYPDTDPFWYTEFVGKHSNRDLTVIDAYEHHDYFNEIIAEAMMIHALGMRGNNYTWISMHTSVYDIANRRLYLGSQELIIDLFEFSL